MTKFLKDVAWAALKAVPFAGGYMGIVQNPLLGTWSALRTSAGDGAWDPSGWLGFSASSVISPLTIGSTDPATGQFDMASNANDFNFAAGGILGFCRNGSLKAQDFEANVLNSARAD